MRKRLFNDDDLVEGEKEKMLINNLFKNISFQIKMN